MAGLAGAGFALGLDLERERDVERGLGFERERGLGLERERGLDLERERDCERARGLDLDRGLDLERERALGAGFGFGAAADLTSPAGLRVCAASPSSQATVYLGPERWTILIVQG